MKLKSLNRSTGIPCCIALPKNYVPIEANEWIMWWRNTEIWSIETECVIHNLHQSNDMLEFSVPKIIIASTFSRQIQKWAKNLIEISKNILSS